MRSILVHSISQIYAKRTKILYQWSECLINKLFLCIWAWALKNERVDWTSCFINIFHRSFRRILSLGQRNFMKAFKLVCEALKVFKDLTLNKRGKFNFSTIACCVNIVVWVRARLSPLAVIFLEKWQHFHFAILHQFHDSIQLGTNKLNFDCNSVLPMSRLISRKASHNIYKQSKIGFCDFFMPAPMLFALGYIWSSLLLAKYLRTVRTSK